MTLRIAERYLAGYSTTPGALSLSLVRTSNSSVEKVALMNLLAELSLENFISLGDIVGYNAEPALCLKMVRDIKWVAMVRGNHDDYTASGDMEMSGFNTNAKKAIAWTREQLDASEREWLLTPYVSTLPGCATSIVHATLDTPENWGYIFDLFHATANFSYQRTSLCFCGHSHVPVAFDLQPAAGSLGRAVEIIAGWTSNLSSPELDTDFNSPDSLTVELKVGHKYLFNIGSIGQPRNGDPRASFAVIDTKLNTVTRYRLPYDISAAQNKIIDAGLPERLAIRLAAGQ